MTPIVYDYVGRNDWLFKLCTRNRKSSLWRSKNVLRFQTFNNWIKQCNCKLNWIFIYFHNCYLGYLTLAGHDGHHWWMTTHPRVSGLSVGAWVPWACRAMSVRRGVKAAVTVTWTESQESRNTRHAFLASHPSLSAMAVSEELIDLVLFWMLLKSPSALCLPAHSSLHSYFSICLFSPPPLSSSLRFCNDGHTNNTRYSAFK